MLIFRLILNSLFFILLHSILASNSEPYNSIESLTELAENKDAISRIREFQRRRTTEIERLQRTIEFLKQDHSKAKEDMLDYLSNPINAYKLIKRMVVGWKKIHEFVENGESLKDFADAWESYKAYSYLDLPKESDLHDAINSLTSVNSSPNGSGSDLIYGSQITWDECYEIGVRLYDNQNYFGALSWLEQALDKMDDNEAYAGIRLDILEYVAYSHYMLGDVRKASLILDQAIQIPVVNSTVLSSRQYFLLNRDRFVQKIELPEPHYISL